MDIVYVHLATDMECGFIAEDESFYEIIFLHFQLHLLAKSRLFTLSAGVRACTCRILYGLQHGRLRNTFHAVIFGMSISLLALATDLRGLRRNASRTLSMLSSDTRGRPGTLAFTQASSFHKLSVPASYVIPPWCVFSKPCTKLPPHCNRRSGHLKTEHTESIFLLRRHLGN